MALDATILGGHFNRNALRGRHKRQHAEQPQHARHVFLTVKLVFDMALGGLDVVLLYLAVAALYAVIPGPIQKGYVVDAKGSPLLYKLNGFNVLLAFLAIVAIVHYTGLYGVESFYQDFWANFAGAFVVGLSVSTILYIKGSRLPASKQVHARRAATVDRPAVDTKDKTALSWNLWERFFNGLEFNPRVGLFDYKMSLYLIGATALEFLLLAATAEHVRITGTLSIALATYVALLTLFVFEYLYHEFVHLYTYDFFAERVGFKLAWGCLLFYPFFYTIGVHALVGASGDITVLQAVVTAVLYVIGWIITRGANNQKYYFKIAPRQPYFGFVQSSGSILMTGWWGAARHFNYLGEIVQAIALALPGWLLTGSLVPWLYPLYYVALLTARQADDEKICETKYGAAWAAYKRAVPYRIVPYVY
eukprot:m.107908 g.107908  ORF g.107908 m.107908 type:complete len:420 (-) comp14260_c1_seq3:106-1365(-)